jgi:hypothetical protein
MNMKKILLLATMFAATVCNAQNVLWNGNDKEVGSDGGFWNRADPTVVEDNGNKCLKVTLKGNPGGWDQEHHNAALPIGDANFKGLRRISFRLKMSDKHNVMVQLEGNGYNIKRVFWYDTPGEWQTMVYEFGAGPDNEKITETGNNVLAIWPFEETADGEGKTVYIDDIQLNGPLVNEVGVRTLADNSLTGEVKVTGNLEAGHYQNTWDGDWHSEDFSDYSLLAAKLATDATVLDATEATLVDPNWEAVLAKCPGITIRTGTSDITGIHALTEDARKAKGTETGAWYDLQGRRIAKPVKGLYIMNGKKYVK